MGASANDSDHEAKQRTKRLLTVEEVAKRLSVALRTVRRLIDRGELPAHRIGRMVRISEDDLERYIRGSRND